MTKRGFRHLLISLLLVVIAMTALSQRASATHLRAGEITVKRVACTLTFDITITVYTNTGSTIRFGDGYLDFGDGSRPFITPSRENVQRPELGPQIGSVSFTYRYTFAGPGNFRISYYEQNRNAGIINMTNSVETPFYIETVVKIDPLLGCDNSPVLTVPPIDKGCVGTAWFHNPGAYDPDGDSLSYELVVPKQDRVNVVNGYHDPNYIGYYLSNAWPTGNEAGLAPPAFNINPVTGLITWDAPGEAGEFNIAFHVIEWRKIKDRWVMMGYVRRDMQIIVEDCSNKRPELIVPADICVVAGTVIDQQIMGSDPDFDDVEIEAYSQVFSISPSPASVVPDTILFQHTAPGVNAKMQFHWATQCAHVKEQAYQVVFKIRDRSSNVSLVQFKTWNIRIVGPAPKWTSLQAQPDHKALLVWQPYQCTNAVTMQVWRRVESNPYDPPACVTGMPPFLGFTLIDEVPIAPTQYTDNDHGKGLDGGAQYCYRLVAVFPSPAGGFSYVSAENCFTSLQDAPVITNVSIGVTDPIAGSDTVRWVPPLKADIDTVLYPPPYTYGVYRAEGLTTTQPFTQVTPGKIAATFFADNSLNTTDKAYSYKIVAFSGANVIDTSSSASSVRLEARPHTKSIDLSWSAVVPWSNVIAAHPQHFIYRGPEGSTTVNDLQLIGSVDVTQQRFAYTDSGQFDHTPLDKNKKYCYCVMTQGGYGNPKITEPLRNLSQILCVQPDDNTPPCQVVIQSTGTNCAEVNRNACVPTSFSNTLTWQRPELACQAEAWRYNVYVADNTGASFMLYVTNVPDTFFIDKNLVSYARCYKVSAISRAGIEGPLSESFCFDNCPHYELPNVFTPGNHDTCNDLFSAFSDRNGGGEGSQPEPKCPPNGDIYEHCARFVNTVNFTVYNRWGKEVYSYQSGGENSIFIDWDGRDDAGKELSSGVYYYIAQVAFQLVDPSKQNQTIKGWVQIVR